MSLTDVEQAAVKVLGAATSMADAARITAEQGWHLLGVPEPAGMGGTLADLAGVVRAVSAAGLSSPLPELHTGFPAIVSGGRLIVPWGPGSADENLAGEPFDVLSSGDPAEGEVLRRWRILHCARLVGGCAGAAARTAAHAATREQFGRPIARFQAVSALVAEAHAQSVLAAAGLTSALSATSPASAASPASAGAPASAACSADAELVAVAALATASRAAGVVARHAHQVHGAIGITRELGLDRLTRRLWAWRDLPGEAELELALGRAVLAGGEALAWGLNDD